MVYHLNFFDNAMKAFGGTHHLKPQSAFSITSHVAGCNADVVGVDQVFFPDTSSALVGQAVDPRHRRVGGLGCVGRASICGMAD
jgi:hypothetical protein